MPYHDQLLQAVESGSERKVHGYLKKNSRPLKVAFAQGWNITLVHPEFQLGSDYRVDFIVVSGHSGANYITLVELEPPSAKLYLKDGTESKVLRKAIRQIKDWDVWLRKNDIYFRQSLAKALAASGTPDYAISIIFDPNTFLFYRYGIVIGRRGNLSSRDLIQRAHETRFNPSFEIATYDRLLNIATSDDWGEYEIEMANKGLKAEPAPFDRQELIRSF